MRAPHTVFWSSCMWHDFLFFSLFVYLSPVCIRSLEGRRLVSWKASWRWVSGNNPYSPVLRCSFQPTHHLLALIIAVTCSVTCFWLGAFRTSLLWVYLRDLTQISDCSFPTPVLRTPILERDRCTECPFMCCGLEQQLTLCFPLSSNDRKISNTAAEYLGYLWYLLPNLGNLASRFGLFLEHSKGSD